MRNVQCRGKNAVGAEEPCPLPLYIVCPRFQGPEIGIFRALSPRFVFQGP